MAPAEVAGQIKRRGFFGYSPRTVEKHVESMLRKTATRSRTQLVAVAGPESSSPEAP